MLVEAGEFTGDAEVFECEAFVAGQFGFGVIPVGFLDGPPDAAGLPAGVVRSMMAFLEVAALLAQEGGASRFFPQFSCLTEALDWLVRLVSGRSGP